MIDFLILPFIFLKVKLLEALWQSNVRKKYYADLAYKELDSLLLRKYLFCNPYVISRKFMQSKGFKNIHVYGETPLYVYELMGTRWGLTSKDHFIELGCGRGRGLFFLSHFYKCKCIGIEWIPEFVQIAQSIPENKVSFYLEDFFTSKHLDGEFIYLNGTCLEDDLIIQLCHRLKQLKNSPKIITTSFSLSEYDNSFKTMDEIKVVFSWGKTSLFLNRISY